MLTREQSSRLRQAMDLQSPYPQPSAIEVIFELWLFLFMFVGAVGGILYITHLLLNWPK
jgi:hypothetical protein